MNKMREYTMKLRNSLFILLALTIFCFKCALGHTSLYAGEQLIEINKIQTLFKFINGDKNKPLIIFIPGAAHLARIAYGFPGGRKDDFLSYWLHKEGYPFLGISYPTDNPVYSKIYPSFNIREWGNQVATVAKTIIDKNHLSDHVVILGWSLGGNIEESATEALNKRHIKVDAFIGLSAVTPISYLGQSIKGSSGNKMLPSGLLDEKYFLNMFEKLVAEQSQYNGHEIIPKNIYLKEFLGNIPVALAGQGYHFINNKFEFNLQYAIDDSGVFHFDRTPWIGLISDDSIEIPRITLIDPSAWNFLRNEMLYSHYLGLGNLSEDPDKYANTKQILNKIPLYLSETVRGNHFFFVGEKGARETAQKIEIILQHINIMKQNLSQNKVTSQ